MADLALVTARRRGFWLRARTPLAIGVNVAAYVAYAVVVQRAGFFDVRAHRALQYKIVPFAWAPFCLLIFSGAAVHRLRAAAVARRQGQRGWALGLAGTGRALLYVSAAVVQAPVAMIGALYLYVAALPVNGL